MFNPSVSVDDLRVGFQRLDAGVYALTASHAYSLALPVQSRKQISAGERTTDVATLDSLHLPWNANVFHPPIATRATEYVRRPNGRRAVPTESIDALFFGNDDRIPYYPTGYPWHCIGKIEVNADGVGTSGSGTLVGKDLVLTARHVVPWGARNATMKFTPAFYNGSSILGSSVYSWVSSAEAYEGDDVGAWDFALLRLYQPLGDRLGYLGVRTYLDRWDDRNLWAACGYPGMAPYGGNVPAYLGGVSVDDADDDGDATELESENQDNSKGESGGPLWARWPNGPYLIGVTSANEKVDYLVSTDYQVLNASGKAMVDMVALARLEIDTGIHIIRPPDLNLSGR